MADRSSAEIERNIERNRAELGQTLSALQNALSPAGLGDALGHELRTQGGAQALALGEKALTRARENPVASAVVAAGLAWLVLGSDKANRESTAAPAPGAADAPAKPAQRYPAPVRASGGPAPQSVAGSETQAEDRSAVKAGLALLDDKAKTLRAQLHQGLDSLDAEARARVVAAREKALDLATSGTDAVRHGAKVTGTTIKENPMLVGGLALALGAAFAGAWAWRRSDQAKSEDRAEVFAEADRIYQEELARAARTRSA